jgi:flavin reductase (DIM6/NTAB) family NADH-FMN oxidoreductase RutF
MIVSATDFPLMEERYRSTYLNSISGFKSLALIGTQNSSGINNLAVFNSIVHLGASPALLGMIIRPDSVRRHTLENILQQGYYTINQVHSGMMPQAHLASAKFSDTDSEFEACGFTAENSGFPAPFIAESRIKFLMKYRQHIHVDINNTNLIIGEIIQIHCPDTCVSSDGFVDLYKAGTLTVAGLDAYYSTVPFDRYNYARPGKSIESLLTIKGSPDA